MGTPIDSRAPDLNDADILRMEGVMKMLKDSQGKVKNLEAFRKEAVERFGEIGFEVDVKVWSTNVEGVYGMEFEILSRLEGQFDPDQMVHEVTNDLLGIDPNPGVIRSSSGLYVPGSHKH